MDNETLSGKIAANRAAANVLNDLLWQNGQFVFAYESNQYASDKSKKEFRREMDRIKTNLFAREQRLFNQLMEMPPPK